MSHPAQSLARLNRVPGVRGSMVVSAADGLTVADDLMAGIPGPTVAALAASLFERTSRSVGAAELGSVSWLQLDAEGGFLFVAAPPPPDELIVVVIADRGVNAGLIRVEAIRTLGELR